MKTKKKEVIEEECDNENMSSVAPSSQPAEDTRQNDVHQEEEKNEEVKSGS